MSLREPFTVEEVTILREFVLRDSTLSETGLAQITSRPLADLQPVLRRHLALFSDPQVQISALVAALNDTSRHSPRLLIPRIDVPAATVDPPILSAGAFAIPPKFRGKQLAQTPTAPRPAFQLRPPSPECSVRSIPIRPRYAAPSAPRRARTAPAIGYLAALLYPGFGPAQVCRVLGECVQNDTHCFLVAFFQPDQSPAYFPGEYLFRLEPDIGFPLGDEAKFDEGLRGDVCVDWMLERIFSAAQNLAINDADVLFPADQVGASAIKPSPQQIQQLMFQCVSCAAMLVVCYLAGRWTIPPEKLEKILHTILRTNPARFATTQTVIERIEEKLNALLAIKGS
jgi:hypothetical protein